MKFWRTAGNDEVGEGDGRNDKRQQTVGEACAGCPGKTGLLGFPAERNWHLAEQETASGKELHFEGVNVGGSAYTE